MDEDIFNYFLFLFLFLFILLYLLSPFLLFIFLIPLFFYIKFVKKIDYNKVFYVVFLSSLFSFFPHLGYGLKAVLIGIFTNIIFLMIFIYLSRYFILKKYYIVAIPSIYYTLFFIYGYLPVKNFWLNLSMFLDFFPLSIRYIGSIGNLFLIILFNLILFDIISSFFKFKKNRFIFVKKNIFISKFYLFILFLLILNFFVFTFSFFPIYGQTLEGETLNVVGIQSNIKDNWFERKVNFEINYDKYINLTKNAISKYRPDIVIWPEYAFTNPIEFDLNLINELNSFANNNNISLILGSILLENKSLNNSKRYDSLYIFENNNLQIYNAYEPVKLFDEYVAVQKNNDIVKIGENNIGLALCFEENFQYIFSKQINQGANLFFVVGNQYYVENDIGLRFTSLNSNLRAVENNRYIFRLENTGYSTVIDNYGRNVADLDFQKEDILFYKIPLINENTFYSQNFKLVKYFILFLSIFLILFSLIMYNRD